MHFCMASGPPAPGSGRGRSFISCGTASASRSWPGKAAKSWLKSRLCANTCRLLRKEIGVNRMNLIVSFDQTDAGLVSQVGGKGSNLIALTLAGFPVPPGFVVTAEAYQLFLGAIASLETELAGWAYDEHDKLRDQCAALRSRLAAQPLPAALQEAIRTALGRFGSQQAFAVRSSSTFEDLAQAAFAGQHDTYLNVRGVDAVLQRVRDCFLSLWGDRAVLYRHHHGFSQTAARMAVVVQQQVACDRAGVGFSIEPVSGRLNRLVIDANYGLGESVVA